MRARIWQSAALRESRSEVKGEQERGREAARDSRKKVTPLRESRREVRGEQVTRAAARGAGPGDQAV
jgi:hypothetical protein